MFKWAPSQFTITFAPEKVERSEMDVMVEHPPSVISTSRPFQVSLYLIHLREHCSNGYDPRIFFLSSFTFPIESHLRVVHHTNDVRLLKAPTTCSYWRCVHNPISHMFAFIDIFRDDTVALVILALRLVTAKMLAIAHCQVPKSAHCQWVIFSLYLATSRTKPNQTRWFHI